MFSVVLLKSVFYSYDGRSVCFIVSWKECILNYDERSGSFFLVYYQVVYFKAMVELACFFIVLLKERIL